MSTLRAVELGVLGPLQVRQGGAPVGIPGAKPRAILTMLGLHAGSVVSADSLVELLWGDDPPRTAAKAVQTHISALRRTLGDGFVLTEGAGWALAGTEVDASRYKMAARLGRDAAAAGDSSQAVARFEEALTLWRGIPELPDGQRGSSEKTRWFEAHAALVEDRADALLATGRAAELIGELEAAVADAPLRERRWGQLMLALYRAGRQGEALGAYQRARSLLADQLGVDPGPDLRRLETAIVGQDATLDMPVAQHVSTATRAVTFLLTDIEGSTAAWEADADAMAVALARHDELVEQVVTSRGGRLIKTRGEGDATFSVFERPSAAAAAAIELQDAITHEPWTLREPMRIRVALHTGEVELRDGDYFGRAVNRVARLRSLASGGQILCSGATAELVIDSLPDDVVLADLGMRQLRNLARPEHVFELRLQTAEDRSSAPTSEAPIERPDLPAVLTGHGPFVGRGRELERLSSTWQTALAGGMRAVLIAGEPGVGKTRLSGEWSRAAYEQGAVVLYGRCDEDLGAPYQPFAEALRSLVPCLGASRLRGLRGIEALLPLVPGLTDVLPDLAAPTRADPDTERYALFDAVVALLEVASASAPVVLVLDDLHWATKPTLLQLRHLLRFGEPARVQIVGTYRSTDLDRSHPLAAMLADLHRDGTADRLQLSGLDEDDVTAYVAEAGYDDEELARALASVTGGNPFFLIEALRHVDESGGVWDQSTLPQGVREAVSRRLSRLPAETNKALAAAAVVGSRFAVELVERVVGQDLVDAFDEASKAGIVIEEPGGRYRFNHAIVRQSLLAELASVRRMRLHQRIATTLETMPGTDDELLAELAHHYFECAWAGNAAKAVEYCRRAADQAMARLAYEGAADLYDRALHALEELDDELPDRDDQATGLLVARCEALLAAGDVVSAAGAVAQLQEATRDSARLAAWATCFDGELSMLIHPERLDEVEAAVEAAADKLAELDDAAGEAKAHTVRAACLARLGRIGDGEIALDHALTAARRAREHRRVNAVLAGAPLAALWGPNPVPRAGGRCLDVVRLLRITTDSPAVEATSTRCQAVLEAFRGRAAAARRMIDSARRTVTELGLRHALLEVEQFAGIVELVVGDSAAAEPHLRKAYNGFRRMGLDADTAETAALLGRACLALDREGEADELCTESERLAGHALKASITWRTVRALLLARQGTHDEARRVAEAAVGLAERTDALVDHGDACLALATVLSAAGDAAGSRANAERAADLYERKGAAALAEKARRLLGERVLPAAQTLSHAPRAEQNNACVRAIGRLDDAVDRDAWDEVEQLLAPAISLESRRKVVGFPRADLPFSQWASDGRRYREMGPMRHHHVVVAVRGERLALARLAVSTTDKSPGAPQDDMFELFGLDEDGRIALQVFFDIEDTDAAMAELDTAHAQFENERPEARRLDNEANRVVESYLSHFPSRDWEVMRAMLADDLTADDRRRVVNAGKRGGRDAEIANVQFIAELGGETITSTAIATRGERLVLARHCLSSRDWPEPIGEMIDVVEINADHQISTQVIFDPDDVDAAFDELDARYLIGEAAPYAHTWQLIMEPFSAINRREPGPAAWNVEVTDHRRVPFAPGDLEPAIKEILKLVPDVGYRVKAVHALDADGAVINLLVEGADTHGNELQWATLNVISFASGKPRMEVYDEDDLDAALTRFEELHPQRRTLENAASRAFERLQAYFAARDWDAMGQAMADKYYSDDRRHVLGAGVRHGRDAEIAGLRATADLGVTSLTSVAIAIRGNRVALCSTRGATSGADSFHTEVLSIVEIDADDRIATVLVFDLDDIDAAFEELDARYVAGEAADQAHTWSVIARAHAAFNRRKLPAVAPDFFDHRPVVTVEAGDPTANIRAMWDFTPDLRLYIEAVHRLSDFGAVVTQASHGTSQAGFEGEWRVIELVTVEGDLVKRGELFEETDVDAAIARLAELSRPAPPLQNAASQIAERLWTHFTAGEWAAVAKMVADDFYQDDRRRVINAGIRHGRDAAIADARAAAGVGLTNATSVVIATRGQRLALTRTHFSGTDQGPEVFHNEAVSILEINSDERVTAGVVFDLDDFDAAIAELDARYLAGEAAPYSHTWSVIAAGYAALNRHEIPATTHDLVSIDHRRGSAYAPGELIAYVRAGWDLDQHINTYVETVHRLTNLGAVTTHASYGSSREGFDAEWRGVDLNTVEGEMVSRSEVFDEADVDVALARFEELHTQRPRLENAATRVTERVQASLAAHGWDAIAEILADDISTDDRRCVVNAGIRRGREAEIDNMRAVADLGATLTTSDVIATRGERLALIRICLSIRDQEPRAFDAESLNVVEIDTDERMAAIVVFDLDDFDAAIAELDARYLRGEAATHAQTWRVITRAFAALNRRETPATTPDYTIVDHQMHNEASGITDYLHASWDITPDLRMYIEVVHRLSDLGGVVTLVLHGTSREGFDAEWRIVEVLTREGDSGKRCEIFDEANIDVAIARFDELHKQKPRLENAATQVAERFYAYFAARDWVGLAETLADNICMDDRRKVVGAGIRRGRELTIADVRVVADLGTLSITPQVVATRGERLVLGRVHFAVHDQRPHEGFQIDALRVIETGADDRISDVVMFDPDDIDAAFEELDSRYLAGEAAAHARTWSVITEAYAALNRREVPALRPDWVDIDHRPLAIESGDLIAYIRATSDLADLNTYMAAVHRLADLGAVVTSVGTGITQEGFSAEWRMVGIITVDGDLIDRCEIFDESDIDNALARFDELGRAQPK